MKKVIDFVVLLSFFLLFEEVVIAETKEENLKQQVAELVVRNLLKAVSDSDFCSEANRIKKELKKDDYEWLKPFNILYAQKCGVEI